MNKDKIKTPITKGFAKVPVVIQLDILECGAASLTMILAYYKKYIPLEQIRIDCGVSRDGSNAKNILVAARSYGLTAKGYRYEIEDLRNKGKFPCIVHWNFSHFVVCNGFKGNKVSINDPASGTRLISIKEFDECFTGIVLMFEPGEDFHPSGKKKNPFTFAKARLVGAAGAVVFSIITILLSSITEIISPIFDRFFIDYLITDKASGNITYFFLMLAVFNIFLLVIDLVRTTYSYKIDGKLAVSGTTSFMKKLFSLPMDFFVQRQAGDLLNRKESNESFSYVFVNIFVPLVFNILFLIIYFVAMVRYNIILCFIAIGTSTLNIILNNYVIKKRVNISKVSAADDAKLESATIAGIDMIDTIKSSGAENGFFKRWSGYQSNSTNNSIKYAKVEAYVGILSGFISEAANLTVLILGVYLVMVKQFTLGMVMAFQGLLTNFMGPVTTLIESNGQIQEMNAQVERIEDVMNYKERNQFLDDKDDGIKGKLKGSIELNDISFGYARLQEPFLKDINIKVKQGDFVSIVGETGCGKSTLAKIICGLYEPVSGTVKYDQKLINQINKKTFSSSVGVVDQNIILFEDTIKNNVSMFNDKIPFENIKQALDDVCLTEEINRRENKYDYKMEENGKDFSGGQRQRLEIARALALNPSILILDEATSALDAETEINIIEAIKRRNITLIVIAHRLSTIIDSDNIIVLNSGTIVGQGKHDELFKSNEIYRNLISNN